MLYAPVVKGYWRQHQLWDGTYTFDDWCDIIEVILVNSENDERVQDYYESQRGN